MKWHLDELRIEHGAWLKGSLYPTRAAVSPDGTILAYFALHGSWDTYFALSKAPWLTALCAWKTVGTWTTGARFEPDGKLLIFGAVCDAQPFHGSCPFPVEVGGVDTNWNRAKDHQFLANGWVPKQSEVTPEEFNPGPYEVTELVKSSPEDDGVVLGRYAEFGSSLYTLAYPDGEERLLAEVVWADFDSRGHLAVATAGGELKVLEIKNGDLETLFSQDMNPLQPDPVEAPAWATRW
jgi:hypothetical protein